MSNTFDGFSGEIECHCECHNKTVPRFMHITACCRQCRHCGRRFSSGFDEHAERCKPKPYTRVVTYHFEVCHTQIVITDFDEDYVYLEETRKNGQEDTHMSGYLCAGDSGEFEWVDGEDLFRMYGRDGLPEMIRNYLNTHGTPRE